MWTLQAGSGDCPNEGEGIRKPGNISESIAAYTGTGRRHSVGKPKMTHTTQEPKTHAVAERRHLMATEFCGLSDLRLQENRLVFASPRLRWDSRS
jgi:hypothetical protein